jgi:hypothetical protein
MERQKFPAEDLKKFKLRVVGDGTFNGSKIENAETGEILGDVHKCIIKFDPDKMCCETTLVIRHNEVILDLRDPPKLEWLGI